MNAEAPSPDPATSAGSDPSARRKRLRRLFAVAALLIGVLAAALLGEVALRIKGVDVPARRHFSPGIYRSDDRVGWALLPNYTGVHREYDGDASTRTNAEGFRGPAWTPARRAAGLRVLCLGDSCTFGRGVDEGEDYPSQLEVALRASGFGDVAVFNAGVPGYDTVQEDTVHAALQPELSPQVVIVGWLPNDVLERSVVSRQHLQVLDGHLVDDVERYQAWKHQIDGGGIYQSALYRFLRVQSRRLSGKSRRWKGDLEDLDYSKKPLEAIVERARAAGALPMLVLFPRLEELGEAGISHHEALAAWAKERGVALVDLPTRWRGKQAEWAPRFLPRDNVHFTAEGYRLLAEEIAKHPLWKSLAK